MISYYLGREYITPISEYYAQHGINMKSLHLVHLSQMLWLNEKNQTLKDMMNPMLISSNLS